jgi:hypothetical protein
MILHEYVATSMLQPAESDILSPSTPAAVQLGQGVKPNWKA